MPVHCLQKKSYRKKKENQAFSEVFLFFANLVCFMAVLDLAEGPGGVFCDEGVVVLGEWLEDG